MAGVDAPVRVLGAFWPSELDPAAIEREFRPWLATVLGDQSACCLTGRLSVRAPQGLPPQAGNLVWHHDEGPAHMIVWATAQPTEIRLDDQSIVTAPPGEAIWFDNARVVHRQPAGTDESRRWFVALRCLGEP